MRRVAFDSQPSARKVAGEDFRCNRFDPPESIVVPPKSFSGDKTTAEDAAWPWAATKTSAYLCVLRGLILFQTLGHHRGRRGTQRKTCQKNKKL